MDYDNDKVDEITVALLYPVTHERQEGYGARAWKSFDWATLDRLHHKGWISNPQTKAKSVVPSEEGYKQAETTFWKQFEAKPQSSGRSTNS